MVEAVIDGQAATVVDLGNGARRFQIAVAQHVLGHDQQGIAWAGATTIDRCGAACPTRSEATAFRREQGTAFLRITIATGHVEVATAKGRLRLIHQTKVDHRPWQHWIAQAVGRDHANGKAVGAIHCRWQRDTIFHRQLTVLRVDEQGTLGWVGDFQIPKLAIGHDHRTLDHDGIADAIIDIVVSTIRSQAQLERAHAIAGDEIGSTNTSGGPQVDLRTADRGSSSVDAAQARGFVGVGSDDFQAVVVVGGSAGNRVRDWLVESVKHLDMHQAAVIATRTLNIDGTTARGHVQARRRGRGGVHDLELHGGCDHLIGYWILGCDCQRRASGEIQ